MRPTYCFCVALRDDDHIEHRRKIGQSGIRSDREAGSEESKSPIDLTILDSGLACGSENRFWSRSAIGRSAIVGKLCH